MSPGLWAGIRAVRGGRGPRSSARTAGGEVARRVPRGGGGSGDRLRLPASGGDHPDRPPRVAAPHGPGGRRPAARTSYVPARRARAGARRALRHAALRLRRRPHRGRGARVPGRAAGRRRTAPTRSSRTPSWAWLPASIGRDAGPRSPRASSTASPPAGCRAPRSSSTGPSDLVGAPPGAVGGGATVVADGVEQVREIARLAAHAGPGARVGLRLVRPTGRAAIASGFRRGSRLRPRRSSRGRSAADRPAHPPRRLPARPAPAVRAPDPRSHGAVPGAVARFADAAPALREIGRARRRHRVARPGRRAGRPPRASRSISARRAPPWAPAHPPIILEPGRALIRDARLAARAGGRAPRTGRGGGRCGRDPGARACCGSGRPSTPPSRATEPSAPRTCSGRSASSMTPSPARCR